MIRMWLMIAINAIRLLYLVPIMSYRAKHPERYSEESSYKFARYIVKTMKLTGIIRTKCYGQENLPKEGGYMMYPNHQGKYDVYGIVSVHPKPCTFVIDENKSNDIFVKQVSDMLHAKRLDKEDLRQGITIINEVAKEVTEGRRYILFPEGQYVTENKNKMGEFKAGCFKISLKSKTPIVPVVLVDSYKVFNGFYPTGIMAKSEVHFIPPIQHEEYKDMKTREIAEVVKKRIQDKLEELAVS